MYDAHGNLPALEAVLDEVAQVEPDVVVFGGDVFAGPFPRESLDLIVRVPGARYVRGNADREADDLSDEARWAHDLLSAEQRAFVGAFEATVTVPVEGLGTVLFCHAVPGDDEPIVTYLSPADVFLAAFGDTPADVVVCGHTHTQYDVRVGGVRVVNAGSVGMPYEAAPGAYWALLGPDVELRRTAYDAEAAARRIRGSGWPQAEGFAARNVLDVPSAAEAAAYFESAAGRR